MKNKNYRKIILMVVCLFSFASVNSEFSYAKKIIYEGVSYSEKDFEARMTQLGETDFSKLESLFKAEATELNELKKLSAKKQEIKNKSQRTRTKSKIKEEKESVESVARDKAAKATAQSGVVADLKGKIEESEKKISGIGGFEEKRIELEKKVNDEENIDQRIAASQNLHEVEDEISKEKLKIASLKSQLENEDVNLKSAVKDAGESSKGITDLEKILNRKNLNSELKDNEFRFKIIEKIYKEKVRKNQEKIRLVNEDIEKEIKKYRDAVSKYNQKNAEKIELNTKLLDKEKKIKELEDVRKRLHDSRDPAADEETKKQENVRFNELTKEINAARKEKEDLEKKIAANDRDTDALKHDMRVAKENFGRKLQAALDNGTEVKEELKNFSRDQHYTLVENSHAVGVTNHARGARLAAEAAMEQAEEVNKYGSRNIGSKIQESLGQNNVVTAKALVPQLKDELERATAAKNEAVRQQEIAKAAVNRNATRDAVAHLQAAGVAVQGASNAVNNLQGWLNWANKEIANREAPPARPVVAPAVAVAPPPAAPAAQPAPQALAAAAQAVARPAAAAAPGAQAVPAPALAAQPQAQAPAAAQVGQVPPAAATQALEERIARLEQVIARYNEILSQLNEKLNLKEEQEQNRADYQTNRAKWKNIACYDEAQIDDSLKKLEGIFIEEFKKVADPQEITEWDDRVESYSKNIALPLDTNLHIRGMLYYSTLPGSGAVFAEKQEACWDMKKFIKYIQKYRMGISTQDDKKEVEKIDEKIPPTPVQGNQVIGQFWREFRKKLISPQAPGRHQPAAVAAAAAGLSASQSPQVAQVPVTMAVPHPVPFVAGSGSGGCTGGTCPMTDAAASSSAAAHPAAPLTPFDDNPPGN